LGQLYKNLAYTSEILCFHHTNTLPHYAVKSFLTPIHAHTAPILQDQ